MKAVSHSVWQLGFMGGHLQLFAELKVHLSLGLYARAGWQSHSLSLSHSPSPSLLAANGAVLFTQPILGLISVISVALHLYKLCLMPHSRGLVLGICL